MKIMSSFFGEPCERGFWGAFSAMREPCERGFCGASQLYARLRIKFYASLFLSRVVAIPERSDFLILLETIIMFDYPVFVSF